MPQAFEIEEGKTFRFRNDVYRVEVFTSAKEGPVGDFIPVTRVATLWSKETNSWLDHDTWMPNGNQMIERFNAYADVIPVNVRTVCYVTEIKKNHGIIPAVDAASNPTGK